MKELSIKDDKLQQFQSQIAILFDDYAALYREEASALQTNNTELLGQFTMRENNMMQRENFLQKQVNRYCTEK